MKLLVHLIGLYLRQPEMNLDWSFLVVLIYVIKEGTSTEYQPACLSSTLLQVNSNSLYLYVCMYVRLCHLRSLLFVILIN